VEFVKSVGSLLDVQVIAYTVLALVPNLLLILWAVARLSREVRLLKAKTAMMENDINLLDQSISSLTTEFQGIRNIEHLTSSGKTPGREK
jgi:hypothetical protein